MIFGEIYVCAWRSNDKPVREGFSTNLYGEGSGEQWDSVDFGVFQKSLEG